MKKQIKPIAQSLREYARGITGGLLFSLPMLYTMELWWAGFIASPIRLLAYMLVGLFLLLGYNHYVGIRGTHTLVEGLLESAEEMGMGLLVTGFVLWLSGRITLDMDISEITGKMVVESMIVAIGISVGKAQLGGGQENEDQQEEDTREPHFISQLNIAMCGAVLIAANVAPTEEIVAIALETATFKLIIMAFVSMLIVAGVLYYTNFRGAEQWVIKPGSSMDVLTGTIMMYAVALTASAFMLWFFGRFDGLALRPAVAEMVVLGFPASLGASAGRLLIQS